MSDAADPHALDELLALRRIAALAKQLHVRLPAGAAERGEIRAQLVEELKFLTDRDAPPPHDAGCICRGNWRDIVKQYEPLIDKRFVDRNGEVYRFFGVVHGVSDYYYGLSSKQGGVRLLSCVGSLEGHGFTEAPSGLHKTVANR